MAGQSNSDNATHPSAGNADGAAVKFDGPKHTPGPWAVSGSMVLAKTRTVVIAECECANSNFKANSPAANAKLIAAAPDMLAALKLALPAIRDEPDKTGAADGIRAAIIEAIAKAEPTS